MTTIRKSGEDYLETIYNLSHENPCVRSTDVARVMEVAKPSAHKALGALAEQGFILKESYGTITLTEQGKTVARGILNKHEAVRKLLVDVLNVSPQNAEKDACKIEHCISEETTQKLCKFLDKR